MFSGGRASFFICLGFMAVCFFSGILWGQVSSRRNAASVVIELRRYLAEYDTLSHTEIERGEFFLSALWIYFRYPLIAFALGLTALGALALPGVSLLFGFFLSFAACCFARSFGETGILMAATVLGLRCLVTLPCFFVLATPAFINAAIKLRERLAFRYRYAQAAYLGVERCLSIWIVAAILLAGALAEVFLSPILLGLVFQNMQI